MEKQFKKYKYTILLGLMIFVFTMVLMRKGNYSIISSSFSAIFSLLVFFIIYNFISKIKYNLLFLLLLPLSLLISVDFIYLLCYSSSLYPANIEAILLTNKTEVLDVTRKTIFPSLIVLPLTIFLSLKTVKELKKTPLRLNIYILLFMTIGYFTADYYINNYGKVNKGYFNLNKSIFERNPLVFKNIKNVLVYAEYKKKTAEYSSKTRGLPDGMFLNKTAEKPLKIFYIIGESSYKGHYSVYGYNANTTPFLEELSKQRLIHCFENVISPASITTLSIKNTLSFSTPNAQSKINDYYNLIELANLVGYETIWISNNGQKIGIHDSEITIIANSSAQTEIIFNKTSDLKLIPILKEKIIRDKPQFFIIHLNGNHSPYSFDDVDTKALGNKGETINYDKSIHHTDRVLREIYKVMKTTDDASLFYYFSDHGEIIDRGHGFLDFSKEAEKQFQIPLISATNKIAKEPIENIVESYRDKETGLLNHLNSIGIISEIIGYSFSEKFKQENIEEGKYIYNVNYKAYNYKEIYPYP